MPYPVRSTTVNPYGAHLRLALDADGYRKADLTGETDSGSVGAAKLIVDRQTHRPTLLIYIEVDHYQGNPIGLIGCIVHEATHAAGMLMEHIGDEITGTTEAYAYLVEWIATWAIRAMPTGLAKKLQGGT